MSHLDAPTAERPDFRSTSFSVFDYAFSFFRSENIKITIILLYAIFALTLWKYIPSAPQYADVETGTCVLSESFHSSQQVKPLDNTLTSSVTTLQFLWNARKLWGAFFLMGVFPALIVKYVFKEQLADYGLTPGIVSRTLFNLGMFLPIMLALGYMSGNTKAFYHVYPFNPLAGASWSLLVAHSIMYFFLYYLAWEFMFRGFLQMGLTDKLGAVPAVLIQVVASTMLHYGHPASETFGCIAGGLLWGFLVYRTKSIFSGWGQHAALGIALDWSLILKAI